MQKGFSCNSGSVLQFDEMDLSDFVCSGKDFFGMDWKRSANKWNDFVFNGEGFHAGAGNVEQVNEMKNIEGCHVGAEALCKLTEWTWVISNVFFCDDFHVGAEGGSSVKVDELDFSAWDHINAKASMYERLRSAS